MVVICVLLPSEQHCLRHCSQGGRVGGAQQQPTQQLQVRHRQEEQATGLQHSPPFFRTHTDTCTYTCVVEVEVKVKGSNRKDNTEEKR